MDMDSPEGEVSMLCVGRGNVKGFFFPRKIPSSSYCDSQVIKGERFLKVIKEQLKETKRGWELLIISVRRDLQRIIKNHFQIDVCK